MELELKNNGTIITFGDLDFESEIEVEIESDDINNGTNSVSIYLTKNQLYSLKIHIEKILNKTNKR